MSAVRRSAAARRTPASFVSIASFATPSGKVDHQMNELEAMAQRAIAGGVAGIALLSSMPDVASAYPVYAQQNFADPVTASGAIVCANCHLGKKDIVIRGPHDVLPDTIFKVKIEVPLKYEKRQQPIASGEKGPLNVGAVVVMPEGYKLAPKDRLPKILKKEMKGLAWSPYSAEKPNIFVVGPVPGQTYQIYPDGTLTNNNVFKAKNAGTVKSVESIMAGDPPAEKFVITVDSPAGEFKVETGAGADVIVLPGDKVEKDGQLTTNPNVGGFGQDERDIVLQSVDRENATLAVMFAFFIAQLAFVLKKKQFEKVQLAEGF